MIIDILLIIFAFFKSLISTLSFLNWQFIFKFFQTLIIFIMIFLDMVFQISGVFILFLAYFANIVISNLLMFHINLVLIIMTFRYVSQQRRSMLKYSGADLANILLLIFCNIYNLTLINLWRQFILNNLQLYFLIYYRQRFLILFRFNSLDCNLQWIFNC